MKTVLFLCVASAVLLCPTVSFGQQERDATVISETAKVFEKAGGKGRTLLTLKRGDRVTPGDSKNGWTAVQASTTRGWMKSSQLRLQDAPSAPRAIAPTPAAPAQEGFADRTASAAEAAELDTRSVPSAAGQVLIADITRSDTPLRRHPSELAPVLLTAPRGTSAVVLDRSGAWVKCEIGDATGWVAADAVSFRGTRTLTDPAGGARIDDRLGTEVERVSDASLRKALAETHLSGVTIRASLAALDSRLRTSDGNWNPDAVSGTGFLLSSLEKDAMRLRLHADAVERTMANTVNDQDRAVAQSVLAASESTLLRYREATERLRTAPREAAVSWGGNATLALASHKRTAIYDYSASSPNIVVNGWVNVPQAGMFRARLDRLDDIVTTRFTRTTLGADWRLPMQTQQFTARASLFSYSDEIALNTYSLIDVQGGWEQLGSDRVAWFADAMFQKKSYSESQPQAFSAVTVHGGARRHGVDASGYEFGLTNRYQSSDDVGLNFDMINGVFSSRLAANFHFNAQYEGYFPLATSGATFLAYHRPGLELRWLSTGAITDYGVRGQYRYHPDAKTLTYGQAMLFAGHREPSILGTNWDAQLLFQRNNGVRNPSFTQGNFDFRSQGAMFYLSGNAVARWLLPDASDSLSEHFSDLYINPGAVLMAGPVRVDIGPFAGATIFLNTIRRSIQDNLNNYARAGLRVNAMAMIGSRVNVRAWTEIERSFYFVEDPYIQRTRKPQRVRLGAEANVQLLRQLALFVNAQTYSIDNDTGIMIPLASGPRDRDKISDTRLSAGARFSM